MFSFKKAVIAVLLFLLLLTCSEKRSQITDSRSVENESSSYKVTFIELGSVNCIPCKMMQPIMEEIEKEYEDQVKVVFHDVWTDEGRPYASKYRIQAIPTQVFIDADGNEYCRHIGFFPKEDIVKLLKQMGVR